MRFAVIIGVIAGLTTGALWGLTFVAPRAVTPFTEYDLAVGRYLVFGLASLLLMFHKAFRPYGVALPDAAIAMLLGSVGYIFYFIATAFAVNLAGAAIPPLVIGLMPVALAIVGNISVPTVRFDRLAVPLVLIVAGLLLVNFGTLSRTGLPADRYPLLLGIVWSFVALFIWIIYGYVNSIVMRRPNPPSALAWAGLQGIGSAIGSLILLIFMFFFGGSYALKLPEVSLSDPNLVRFIIWCLVMGVIGSWVATWCWSIASARLPLAVCAQLIVAETVFGLSFGFIFEGRTPYLSEAVGGTLQIIGVMVTLYLFSRANNNEESRSI
ncbi:MAG TPA: EamA/RhaT family transporter [Gammaproteobacteria bacterium]|nr:EamA/RhaT family transporter [Gammaproteobacteria bacterium]